MNTRKEPQPSHPTDLEEVLDVDRRVQHRRQTAEHRTHQLDGTEVGDPTSTTEVEHPTAFAEAGPVVSDARGTSRSRSCPAPVPAWTAICADIGVTSPLPIGVGRDVSCRERALPAVYPQVGPHVDPPVAERAR